MRFEFLTTNNQVEFKSVITRMTLDEEIGVEHIRVRTNSQLVMSQIKGESQAKDLSLQRYLKLATGKLAGFKKL